MEIRTEINLTEDKDKVTLVLGSISEHSGDFIPWRTGIGSYGSPANDTRLKYVTEPLDHQRSPEHAEKHLCTVEIPDDYPYAIARKYMHGDFWKHEVLFKPVH